MIPPGEVHLWWAQLDIDDAVLADLEGLLEPRERERAARFRIAAARRRFVAARAALRRVLGTVTGTEPAAVRFAYGERGKPRLAGGGPRFNASDSGGHVVVAVAGAELGVDVEIKRPLRMPDRLARRICTDRELAQLGRIPPNERDAALLRLWTCKEAGLKALGLGLAGGVRNVAVELDPGGPPRLRWLCGDSAGWSMLAADPGPEAICTVVISGSGWRLVHLQCT